MTYNLPLRLTILQSEERFLIDALTFIVLRLIQQLSIIIYSDR